MFSVGDTGPLRAATGRYEVLAHTHIWGSDVIVAKLTMPSGAENLVTRFPDGRIYNLQDSEYDFIKETDMVDITNAIPLPSETTKKHRAITLRANSLIKRFQNAYQAVYGRVPKVSFDGEWCDVDTQPQRVSLSRLKEMARMLEDRVL